MTIEDEISQPLCRARGCRCDTEAMSAGTVCASGRLRKMLTDWLCCPLGRLSASNVHDNEEGVLLFLCATWIVAGRDAMSSVEEVIPR